MELRTAGFKVDCYPEGISLSKQLKYANRKGYAIAIMIGPDEMINQSVTIKDLRTSQQQTITKERLLETIKQLISS
jgi:histidyl-tRNA synthetase